MILPRKLFIEYDINSIKILKLIPINLIIFYYPALKSNKYETIKMIETPGICTRPFHILIQLYDLVFILFYSVCRKSFFF